jgi:AcrR family transcriptional regulator
MKDFMARNKYPEQTLEKILKVAQRLFLEKGFDQTTIQDIVDGLEGMTRGAVYHHFKSKDEIMEALIHQMFLENNPFDELRNRKDLNGLQKLKLAVTMNQSNQDGIQMSEQALPLLQNPRILAGIIESNRKFLSPLWLELMEEGIADGSIQTAYAKQLSELLPLLELWLMPTVYPASPEEMVQKFVFISEMLKKMGLPLFDDEMIDMVQQQLQRLAEK